MRSYINLIFSYIFIVSCLLSASVAYSADWPGDNPADPDYLPPTAEDFDTVIMGRDAFEADARRQQAVDYFRSVLVSISTILTLPKKVPSFCSGPTTIPVGTIVATNYRTAEFQLLV